MKTNKYVSHILKRRCFMDFITALGGKCDEKEWTEILAIHRWVDKLARNEKFDIMFDIGCGRRPTLGVYTALNTHSIDHTICVDPQLNVSLAGNIDKIEFLDCGIETVRDMWDNWSKCNIIACCNHAHIGKNVIEKFLSQFKSWVYITNPCCVDNRLHNHMGFHYKDMNIMSPKNNIYVYRGGK